MLLDGEFMHHLHELMVEVSEAVAEPEAKYKAELVWKAQKTNNAAAMPIAYKDAALHALRTRFDQTVAHYIEAQRQRGGVINDAVEKEMLQHISLLTSGPNALHFPPGLHGALIPAVQQSYSRERQRLAHQLIREAANRLRELKMKSKQVPQVPITTINNQFNAPVGTAYINSTHHSTTSFEITLGNLQDIDRISQGHPQLEEAAREIHAASADKMTMLDKAKNWVMLLSSVEGLTEKIVQHYPQIAALIHHLTTS
jgi:hypothetical protein